MANPGLDNFLNEHFEDLAPEARATIEATSEFSEICVCLAERLSNDEDTQDIIDRLAELRERVLGAVDAEPVVHVVVHAEPTSDKRTLATMKRRRKALPAGDPRREKYRRAIRRRERILLRLAQAESPALRPHRGATRVLRVRRTHRARPAARGTPTATASSEGPSDPPEPPAEAAHLAGRNRSQRRVGVCLPPSLSLHQRGALHDWIASLLVASLEEGGR